METVQWADPSSSSCPGESGIREKHGRKAGERVGYLLRGCTEGKKWGRLTVSKEKGEKIVAAAER